MHFIEMLKYAKVKREYDAWKAEKDILDEARRLAGGNMIQPFKVAQSERQPPKRPHFAICGPAGHFVTLAERMKKLAEQQKRARDREWAEQDRIKLAQEMGFDTDGGPASPSSMGSSPK